MADYWAWMAFDGEQEYIIEGMPMSEQSWVMVSTDKALAESWEDHAIIHNRETGEPVRLAHFSEVTDG